jgi:hypothetical protein
MTDTFAIGMAAVVWFLAGALAVVLWFDLDLHRRALPTVGDQLRVWSAGNPWWSAVVVLVMFTLLAHFVLNPLP